MPGLDDLRARRLRVGRRPLMRRDAAVSRSTLGSAAFVQADPPANVDQTSSNPWNARCLRVWFTRPTRAPPISPVVPRRGWHPRAPWLAGGSCHELASLARGLPHADFSPARSIRAWASDVGLAAVGQRAPYTGLCRNLVVLLACHVGSVGEDYDCHALLLIVVDQPSRFHLRQPPARLLAMMCLNISVSAGALMVSPWRTATVRAVLLS